MSQLLDKKLSPYRGNAAFDAATITIGSETGGNTRKLTVQLKDARYRNIQASAHVFAYLSSQADGSDIITSAPSGGWSIATHGLLIPVVTNKAAHLVSEATGVIDINIVEAGAYTCYLVLCMPDGSLVISSVITFAG